MVWIKGTPRAEETKRKIGKANSIALLGHKQSYETIQKRAKKQIGRKRPNQVSPMKGKHQTESAKELIRKSRAKQISPMKGKHHSEETKRKMSITQKNMSDETIDKIRTARLKQVFPLKDSIPEKMMQLALKLENIPFEKHRAILGQPDIFIEPNICLFIDGCYWHDCSLCGHNSRNSMLHDTVVNHKLMLDGYIVIRIWEHDIIDSGSGTKKKIIDMINQMRLNVSK